MKTEYLFGIYDDNSSDLEDEGLGSILEEVDYKFKTSFEPSVDDYGPVTRCRNKEVPPIIECFYVPNGLGVEAYSHLQNKEIPVNFSVKISAGKDEFESVKNEITDYGFETTNLTHKSIKMFGGKIDSVRKGETFSVDRENMKELGKNIEEITDCFNGKEKEETDKLVGFNFVN